MPGTKRCNDENNVELCGKDQKSWEFNKQCPKVQTCRGGHCIVEPKSCGDGTCQKKEGCNLCPKDCGACCGNSKCEPNYGEDRYTCKNDCKVLDKGIQPGKDGGNPGKDSGSPGKDKGGVKPCNPGALFCKGAQIHKCSSDGKSTIVQQDCQKMSFPGVNYQCKVCSNSKPGCKPDRKEFFKGFTNGRNSFSYSYRGYYTCEKQKAFASVLWQGTTLIHSVMPNGSGSMPVFTVQIKNAVSGQNRTMVHDSTSGTPQIVVSIVHSTSPSVSCTNYYSTINPPTQQGVVKATFSGKSKGSTVQIIASGQLLCYSGGQGQWENFAYNGEGIIF